MVLCPQILVHHHSSPTSPHRHRPSPRLTYHPQAVGSVEVKIRRASRLALVVGLLLGGRRHLRQPEERLELREELAVGLLVLWVVGELCVGG